MKTYPVTGPVDEDLQRVGRLWFMLSRAKKEGFPAATLTALEKALWLAVEESNTKGGSLCR